MKGSVFVSLLGGAVYAAVSRDFRSVLRLRFYLRVYGFISIERAFQIQGFYSFIFRLRLYLVSLLGGAVYAAVSRDFRSVLHLRFYRRVYGFISIERAFQIQGFYSFIFRLRLYLK